MLRSISIFIGIYVLGYFISIFSAATFGATSPAEFSYYSMIIYSILYLSGIIAVCTYLIINTIKDNNR